jgi:hypothetical protein
VHPAEDIHDSLFSAHDNISICDSSVDHDRSLKPGFSQRASKQRPAPDSVREPPLNTVPSLQDIISFLGRGKHLSALMQDHMWSLVLDDREPVPTCVQEQLLGALSSRVRGVNPRVAKKTPPRRNMDDSPLTHLIEALCSVLLGPVPGTAVHPHLTLWAYGVAQQVFTAEAPLPLRWGQFVLLGSAVRRGNVSLNELRAFASQDEQGAPATDLLVITVLRAVETHSLHTPLPSAETLHELEETCSSAWTLWTNRANPALTRSPFVERAVLSMVLRFSRTLGSMLGYACIERCDDLALFVEGRGHDPIAEKQVELLAVESLNYAKSVPDAPQDLPDLITRWRMTDAQAKSVISKILIRMSAGDPALAFNFFTSALSANIIPNLEATECYAEAMTHSHLGYALMQHIDHANLPNQALRRLLIPVFQSDDVRSWCNEDLERLLRVVHETTPSFILAPTHRPGLEGALLALAERGRSAIVVVATVQVNTAYPGLLQTSTVTQLMHWLVNHRQYRLAFRLFRRLAPSRRHEASQWRKALLYRFIRKGASSKMARRLDSKNDHRALVILSRMSGHRTRDTPSTIAIRSVRQLRKAVKTASAQEAPRLYTFTARVCVEARRVKAMREVMAVARHDARVNEASRAVLGNLLVQAAFRPRRGCKNRAALQFGLRVLSSLSSEFGVRPDRVTVNILVRAFATWTRGTDAAFLRMLFDHFTRTGYPAGPHGVAPFRTATMEATGGTALLRDVQGTIDLWKHVQPLYKTLIHGFRIRGDTFAAEVVKDSLNWAKDMDAVQKGSWRAETLGSQE